MKLSLMRRTAPLLALGLVLAGCGEKNKFAPPPPPPVTVANPEVRDVTVYKTFPGTLAAVADVEVRARVRGVLEKCHFEDGKAVKQGDPLFLIEQAPFKATVQAAEASLAQTEASLKLATATRARIEKAATTNAVSQVDVEVARAEEAGADAAVKQAAAALESARIDFSYTEIEAPVAGRTSRSLVDPGNLVDGGQSTLLTTIVDDSSIRAYFEVDERTLLFFLDRHAGNDPAKREEARAKLELQLELTDGTIYGPKGKIDFVDNEVDPGTRTMRVRAVFPNPEGKLVAGLFASVGIPNQTEDAVLIPALAIQRDLAGEYVWVVGEGDVVRRQAVEAGATIGRERIIETGLTGSERVIVAGIQRAREGATVSPKTAPAAEPAAEPKEKPEGENAPLPEKSGNGE